MFRGLTMGAAFRDGVLVVAHRAVAPSAADWARYCDLLRAHLHEARGQIALSVGGVPDAAQRRAAVSLLPEDPGFATPRTAVLTDDVVGRAVVTALNWFLDDTQRAFRLDDVAGAAAHLGIDVAAAQRLVDLAWSLISEPQS